MRVVRQLLQGEAIRPHLAGIARLRMEIFREFPYLYLGEEAYELEYLRSYADSDNAFVVLAWDGDVLAGALTGVPLQEEMPEFTAPFAHSSYALDRLFYIGELLFLPRYRGQGLGTMLFGEAEAHVRSRSSFSHLTCATVVRPDEHPFRPDDFIPIDGFLHRHAFERMDGVTVDLSWPEVDGVTRGHAMQFWIRPLLS